MGDYSMCSKCLTDTCFYPLHASSMLTSHNPMSPGLTKCSVGDRQNQGWVRILRRWGYQVKLRRVKCTMVLSWAVWEHHLKNGKGNFIYVTYYIFFFCGIYTPFLSFVMFFNILYLALVLDRLHYLGLKWLWSSFWSLLWEAVVYKSIKGIVVLNM